jgi:hypothetical protein
MGHTRKCTIFLHIFLIITEKLAKLERRICQKRIKAPMKADVRSMDQPKSLHDLVMATLTEMGICPASLSRTFLLRDRRFVGQKYSYDGGWVIWLAEENAIKVYAKGGTLLKTVNVEMTEKGAAA